MTSTLSQVTAFKTLLEPATLCFGVHKREVKAYRAWHNRINILGKREDISEVDKRITFEKQKPQHSGRNLVKKEPS